MVTAEFAVALPAFVLVLLAALTAVSVVAAELRCVAAAAAAARLAARGEPAAVVRSAALADSPSGGAVQVADQGTTVAVTVRARIAAPGPLGFLPALPVVAHVVQAVEPAPPDGGA